MILLALAGMSPSETLAADFNGALTIGSGYLKHPLGVLGEPAAGYLTEFLRLSTTFEREENQLRLGYEGRASQFGNETSLGSTRHALGAEWFRSRTDGSQSFSAGIQGAVRQYLDFYNIMIMAKHIPTLP